MEFHIDSQTKQGIITINDEISIQDSKKFKELFNQAANETNNIIIDFENVSYIDLSFFQLLYAAQQKCKALKKGIFFKESSIDFIKKSVNEAGFSHSITVNSI